MTTADNDVVALLTRQHRRLESLMQTLLDAEIAAERSELLARAGDELAVHILAEEQIVYPRVHPGRTEDILLESPQEHLSLKRLLADLLMLSPEDATFHAKCKVLEEQARHHHKEEEEHLFPSMKALLGTQAQAAMGSAVLQHEHALRQGGSPRERIGDQTDAAAALN